MLVGNSGSPRWYQGSAERLDQYLGRLRAWGATSTEMVVHHGPADERTARVHVLAADWMPMIERYREHGIPSQLHVSLDRRFATERWHHDRRGLQAEYAPIVGLVEDLAHDQDQVVLVLHGAGDPALTPEENQHATIGLLRWLAEEFERLPGHAVAALELGAQKVSRPTAAARSRADVLAIVEAVDSRHVGICWDLAHDLENAGRESGWTATPPEAFLSQVVHVHVHDLDEQGVAHCPLLLGRVPVQQQLAALARVGNLPPITMEIRWRCAARLGDPWEMLGASYTTLWEVLRGVSVGSAPAHD